MWLATDCACVATPASPAQPPAFGRSLGGRPKPGQDAPAVTSLSSTMVEPRLWDEPRSTDQAVPPGCAVGHDCRHIPHNPQDGQSLQFQNNPGNSGGGRGHRHRHRFCPPGHISHRARRREAVVARFEA